MSAPEENTGAGPAAEGLQPEQAWVRPRGDARRAARSYGGSSRGRANRGADAERTHRPSRQIRSRRGGKPRRRRPGPIFWTVSALALLLVAAVVWIGVRGYLAVSELQTARASISELQAQVSGGGKADTDQVAADAQTLVTHLSSARSLTGDPIWRAAEVIPFAGSNLSALRETTDTLGRVGDDVVLPVVDLAITLKAADASAEPGVLPLQPLVNAVPELETAAATASDGAARLDAIDTSQVVGPLGAAIDQIRPVMHTASEGLQTASTLSQVVPSMLGANGPRTQLALFLNNAELRSSGGIVGALAEIKADGGKIELGRQSSAGAINSLETPAGGLSVQQLSIFGSASGRFMQNASAFPEFSTTGRFAAEMWNGQFGTQPDGAIAVDPVALSYLLEATGPITLSTGDELRADNVVDLLLKDVYARYSNPADQDAFFAAAAGEVFRSLASGGADPLSMVQALSKAGAEGRLRMWSAVPEEEALLEQTVLAPTLPRSEGTTENFAVYYNDATGAKMDYYLDSSVAVRQEQCTADGLPIYDIDVTVTNNAPADAAQSLSGYVTGGGGFGVEPGRIRTDIAVYGAKESLFLEARQGGEPFPLQSALDGGHFVAKLRTEIGAGESETISLKFVGTVRGVEDTGVRVTPLIRPIAVTQLTAGC